VARAGTVAYAQVSMQHIEGSFRGVGGLKIYTQQWLPEGPPRAVLLLVHGYAEHSGRYGNLVGHFVQRGYAICALDHRGHGRSEGARVHIDDFADYLADLATYEGIVRAQFPGTKVFLLGHSMGAMIATAYLPAHQHSFAGAVISGGGIAPEDAPPPAPVGDLAATVSRDPAVVQAYRDDPLNYHGPPLAARAEAMRGWRSRLRDLASEITLPIIIMAGSGSPLGDAPRSAAMYDAVRSADKTLKLYDGLYHEIFNEPERALVLADLEAWLSART